jgi:hypothetical protein
MEQEAITAALSSLEKAPPVKPSEAFKATKLTVEQRKVWALLKIRDKSSAESDGGLVNR